MIIVVGGRSSPQDRFVPVGIAGPWRTLQALVPYMLVVAIRSFVASACPDNLYSIGNAAMLAYVPRRLRGQPMALINVMLGTRLCSALLAGAVSDSLCPRLALLTMDACLLGCAVLTLSTPLLHWWRWRQRTYAAVSKDDWLRRRAPICVETM